MKYWRSRGRWESGKWEEGEEGGRHFDLLEVLLRNEISGENWEESLSDLILQSKQSRF